MRLLIGRVKPGNIVLCAEGWV